MKKILIILLILFLAFFAFGKYCQIKKQKAENCRNEINKKIDELYPIAIKEIDGIENKIIQEKDPDDKQLILDMGVDGVLLNSYGDLIDIFEKYVGKNKIQKKLGTDFSLTVYYELHPYLIDYKVDTTKLDNLNVYASEKQEMLEKKYASKILQMQTN